MYSLKEAIENHRETHHPTMLNKPNAIVNAFIELNMRVKNFNLFYYNKTLFIWISFIWKILINTRLLNAESIYLNLNSLFTHIKHFRKYYNKLNNFSNKNIFKIIQNSVKRRSILINLWRSLIRLIYLHVRKIIEQY